MDEELKRMVQQLLQQISISDFRDELGHSLKKFKAYEDLRLYMEKLNQKK